MPRANLEKIALAGRVFVQEPCGLRRESSAWLHCRECGRSHEVAKPLQVAGGWLLEAAITRCPTCRRRPGELPQMFG